MYELLHELANDLKLRILGNFKKIIEMDVIKEKCPAGQLKSKVWQLRHRIAKKNQILNISHKNLFY